MSKDIETIEEVLKHFAPDHWAILDLGQALQQIEKIIKERVIGVNYKKVKQPVRFSTADSGYCRNTRLGRTCTDRQTALRENNVRNKQRQALTNALYGKGEK